MLRNEKYMGDLLIQKPPQNYLTKRPDKTKDYTEALANCLVNAIKMSRQENGHYSKHHLTSHHESANLI